jgi:hypothetical protein
MEGPSGLNDLGNRTEVFRFILSIRAHTELTMYADANDGKPWTEQDLEDLKVCIDSGLTISQTAAALSREGTIEDVLRMAQQRGWKFHQIDGEVFDANASLR